MVSPRRSSMVTRRHLWTMLLLLLPLTAQGQTFNLNDTVTEYSQRGTFYHDRFEGRKTSCGEIFDQNLFTAAHKTIKMGTLLMVTSERGEQVIVRVNDRCPIRGVLDLTRRAAVAIGIKGSQKVSVRVIPDNEYNREKWLAQDYLFDSVATRHTKVTTRNSATTPTKRSSSLYNVVLTSVDTHGKAFNIIQKLPEEYQDIVLVDNSIDSTSFLLILDVRLSKTKASAVAKEMKQTFPRCEIVPAD